MHSWEWFFELQKRSTRGMLRDSTPPLIGSRWSRDCCQRQRSKCHTCRRSFSLRPSTDCDTFQGSESKQGRKRLWVQILSFGNPSFSAVFCGCYLPLHQLTLLQFVRINPYGSNSAAMNVPQTKSRPIDYARGNWRSRVFNMHDGCRVHIAVELPAHGSSTAVPGWTQRFQHRHSDACHWVEHLPFVCR